MLFRSWPAAGTYVITELLEGTVQIMHLEGHPFGKTPEGKELADGTTSQLEGCSFRFVNPPEAFLSVEMREGGGKRNEYSAAAIARGEVLIMPAPNPNVSSGAGALLREAVEEAAWGRVVVASGGAASLTSIRDGSRTNVSGSAG